MSDLILLIGKKKAFNLLVDFSKDVNDRDRLEEKAAFTGCRAWGTLGVLGAAWPFIQSLAPNRSTRLKGQPVSLDVSAMAEGEQKTVLWRGKPVWVIKRSTQDVEALKMPPYTLRDPDSDAPQQPQYAKNFYRSIDPNYLVLLGVCTHLGCAPTYRPEKGAIDDDYLEDSFAHPGSKFDFLGESFRVCQLLQLRGPSISH